MIKCDECAHDISSKAVACVNCGNPVNGTDEAGAGKQGMWQAVMRARTPINIFAIAMMASSAVLGVSAANIDNEFDLTAFTYTLHVFLAVAGMFFVTLLFNRSGVYHPEDIARAKSEGYTESHNDNPTMAAILILIMLFAYGVYQIVVRIWG